MAVFCLATYGEGDPTDNAMDFIDWLKNGDPDLNGLNYAVSVISILYFISIKSWRIKELPRSNMLLWLNCHIKIFINNINKK